MIIFKKNLNSFENNNLRQISLNTLLMKSKEASQLKNQQDRNLLLELILVSLVSCQTLS